MPPIQDSAQPPWTPSASCGDKNGPGLDPTPSNPVTDAECTAGAAQNGMSVHVYNSSAAATTCSSYPCDASTKDLNKCCMAQKTLQLEHRSGGSTGTITFTVRDATGTTEIAQHTLSSGHSATVTVTQYSQFRVTSIASAGGFDILEAGDITGFTYTGSQTDILATSTSAAMTLRGRLRTVIPFDCVAYTSPLQMIEEPSGSFQIKMVDLMSSSGAYTTIATLQKGGLNYIKSYHILYPPYAHS